MIQLNKSKRRRAGIEKIGEMRTGTCAQETQSDTKLVSSAVVIKFCYYCVRLDRVLVITSHKSSFFR